MGTLLAPVLQLFALLLKEKKTEEVVSLTKWWQHPSAFNSPLNSPTGHILFSILLGCCGRHSPQWTINYQAPKQITDPFPHSSATILSPHTVIPAQVLVGHRKVSIRLPWPETENAMNRRNRVAVYCPLMGISTFCLPLFLCWKPVGKLPQAKMRRATETKLQEYPIKINNEKRKTCEASYKYIIGFW